VFLPVARFATAESYFCKVALEASQFRKLQQMPVVLDSARSHPAVFQGMRTLIQCAGRNVLSDLIVNC